MTMMMTATKWALESWRERPANQMPAYDDSGLLRNVESVLAKEAPLVDITDIVQLKTDLASVARGEAFVVHGGDCAESASEFGMKKVVSTLSTLGKMADIIARKTSLPVIQIGRIAGQFAKPRSNDTETRDGVTLPIFRGENVNRSAFTAEARRADPRRMRTAFCQSVQTMAIMQDQGFGICTSHEALLLNYEQAMTRIVASKEFYNASAHFLWIGARTHQLDNAHVEYIRGVQNPIGLKCSPNMTPDELIRLIEILNPDDIPGRLTLIIRMGHDKIRDKLPALIQAVKREGKQVVWSCDPMHGNTITAPSGYKTRRLDHIKEEITGFFEIHRTLGTHPGGIHLEMTGEHVTECVGGRVKEEDLCHKYQTVCDPRLNAAQASAVAFHTALEFVH